jgi:hypothetical protein
MTDRDFEGRLRAGLRQMADEGASAELRASIIAIPDVVSSAPQRRAVRWGFPPINRFAPITLAATVVVIITLLGIGLFLRLSPNVGPSPVPGPTHNETATPAARAGALIAFIRTTQKPNDGTNCGYTPEPTCGTPRLWIVGSDGSGAHELFPDGLGTQSFAGWAPDGTLMLYTDNGNLYVTDANGSEPQPAKTGCDAPCEGDSQASFSSDGTRIVFVRISTDASGYSGAAAIATMDLASGRVVQLSSTAAGGGALPEWSPDGTQILFFRYGEKDTGGPVAPVKSAVLIVDSDGQNLRQVTPTTIAAQFPGWSPDGSLIVFTSPDGPQEDIFTIRPDGTDLHQLTADGASGGATWTPDGRIMFVRGSSAAGNSSAPGFWTMDADGTNPAQLMPAMLAGDEDPMWTRGPIWQPIGGPAIVPPPWNPSTSTAVGPPPPTPVATPTPTLATGFSWTGSMSTAGTDTATRLADGRVLITKGCSTPELYDPKTGTFSPTGSLVAQRGGETATLLQDGRVLITGGGSCGDAEHVGIWSSAELYDPATGRFSPTGSMSEPRERHTATLLADGRVLITGGNTGASPIASLPVVLASYHGAMTAATANVLASAELYDPKTGTFSRTGSMSAFRDAHTATLLQDGRVLVVGGGGEGYATLASADLFNPATGKFSQTGSMTSGRWLHTATLLRDGRVLIAGGRASDDSTYATAELYDPRTGTFSLTGSMQTDRQQHTATLLPDGRILITGGYESDGQHWQVLSSAELYDPATSRFTPIGSMGQPRMGQAATLLKDGTVLIAGGEDIGNSGGVGLTSAVLYQP